MPAALRLHQRQHRVRGVHQAQQVNVDHPPPVLRIRSINRAELRHRGIVDKYIDAAPCIARDTWGRVDILVNDAAVAQLGPIDGANTEDWRRMVNINLLGLMYATHAVLPLMKAQGSGHIVNVSSRAGRIAQEGTGVYSATKCGVGAFSESLRQEVAKNHIRVTVIEPGVVATEMLEHLTVPTATEQALAWMQQVTPLASEDIAAAIVYAVTPPEQVDVNEMLN